MTSQVTTIVTVLLTVYGWLIIAYAVMSWFPIRGFLYDVYEVLDTVVGPYVGLFRRFIPPIGAVDISPLVAFFVVQLVIGAVRALR